MLTQEYLKKRIQYDPETGVFTWLPREFDGRRNVNVWNTRYAGTIAGSTHIEGYIKIAIDDRLYNGHALAFLYMTGEIPKGEVDHLNHDRGDNKWSNLRVGNKYTNQQNRSLAKHNSSGFNGVYWCKKRKKWKVQINFHGVRIYLGAYVRKSDAIAERKKANIDYGFHENHGVSSC